MDTGPISIKVTGLGKRFRRDWIFRNLTTTFSEGNRYAITGPNGSGKSTLLSVLWGQTPPTAGKAEFFSGATPIDPEELYRSVAIAAPYMDLIEELTLAEHIDFHFRLKPLRHGATMDDLPRIMNLSTARDKQLRFFSSGMRQRVRLALALYSATPLLFLDEPATNLDREGFEWYHEQLGLLPPTMIVFIASNNPDEYRSANASVNILDHK